MESINCRASDERADNRLIKRKMELPGNRHRENAPRFGSFCKSSHMCLSPGGSGHVKLGMIEFVRESISKYPFDDV
jgi:hypothetical protein